MKITVQVKPHSKKEEVLVQSDGTYLVRVHAPPVEGQANARVCELLAKHLGVPKSHVRLVSGSQSKKKIIEVLDR